MFTQEQLNKWKNEITWEGLLRDIEITEREANAVKQIVAGLKTIRNLPEAIPSDTQVVWKRFTTYERNVDGFLAHLKAIRAHVETHGWNAIEEETK